MRRAWWVPGALAAVVVVLLGTSGVLVLQRGAEVDPGSVVAARQAATAFFSLDHRHPEKDVEAVLATATGAFKTQYAARRSEIVAGVKSKKLVVTATVPEQGVAVEYAAGDSVRVLVPVDVTTSTRGAAGTHDRYRARVLLTRVGGRWLTSGMNQVG